MTLADCPRTADKHGSHPDPARIEVFPKAALATRPLLNRFVLPRCIARWPQATNPGHHSEAGHLIGAAFVGAGIIAVVVITVLLVAVRAGRAMSPWWSRRCCSPRC